jgi:integrase
VVEPSTLAGYTYSLHKHLVPFFGDMKMMFITPAVVREWVTFMTEEGVKPATIRKNKEILSGIFTTAVVDEVNAFHPCYGVKTPTVPKKPLEIITPEQFDDFYLELQAEVFRLFVETKVETGARYGEITEFRPRDLNRRTRILTVSRAVVQVDPKFHPTGDRFWVKQYPKEEDWRRFKLSDQICTKIFRHIDDNNIADDALIFAMPDQTSRSARWPRSFRATWA